MSSQKDYYKTLGVAESASEGEIKQVYRQLAKKYHPDANPSDKKSAEEKFKEVSEAYYVLGDAKRRAEYDAFKKSGFSHAGRGQAGGRGFEGAQGFDFEEILKAFRQAQNGGGGGRTRTHFSGGFEDIFGGPGFFGSRGGPSEEDYPEEDSYSSDAYATLKISKNRAQKGGDVSFHTNDGRKITVKIPAGTVSGKKLRLARQGSLCHTCRHPGDLILTIKVE